MPRFDGTGPSGRGPLSGRGEGYCIVRNDMTNPVDTAGYMGLQADPYSGRGIGNTGYQPGIPFRGMRCIGRGRGRGRRGNGRRGYRP